MKYFRIVIVCDLHLKVNLLDLIVLSHWISDGRVPWDAPRGSPVIVSEPDTTYAKYVQLIRGGI